MSITSTPLTYVTFVSFDTSFLIPLSTDVTFIYVGPYLFKLSSITAFGPVTKIDLILFLSSGITLLEFFNNTKDSSAAFKDNSSDDGLFTF